MWPPKRTHTCTRTHKYTHARHHDTAGAASAAPGHYSVITWQQQPNYIQILCPRCLQVRPSVRLCVRQSFCPLWSSCSSCVPLRPPLCHVCKHPRVSWGLFVTPGTAAVTVCCVLPAAERLGTDKDILASSYTPYILAQWRTRTTETICFNKMGKKYADLYVLGQCNEATWTGFNWVPPRLQLCSPVNLCFL